MWASPKFFRNRRVHILIPCSPILMTNGVLNNDFLVYNPCLEEKFLSPTGMIKSYDKDLQIFTVETKGVDGCIYDLQFPANEIYLYTNGQKFYKNNLNQLELEDGIRANYSTLVVKAKFLEISMKLAPIISKLDFSSENGRVNFLQQDAVLAIRKCLNLVSFYRGVIRERYGRTDCIGKLAIFGQAQYHGLSSAMSAFIYPFTPILGIELLYRGGYSFIGLYINRKINDPKSTVEVSNLVEKHQWLQINLQPNMSSFIIDIWYQEEYNDDKYLFTAINKACSTISYPHPKLLLKNTVVDIKDTDLYFE